MTSGSRADDFEPGTDSAGEPHSVRGRGERRAQPVQSKGRYSLVTRGRQARRRGRAAGRQPYRGEQLVSYLGPASDIRSSSKGDARRIGRGV
jgi:hypothetical protein